MAELLQDLVARQARFRPDSPAVVLEDEKLSYGELEKLACQIARALKLQGCCRGDRVCLLVSKSPVAVAAVLGIYKADCVCVPLDPASPPARLWKILSLCRTRWLLCADGFARILRELLRHPDPKPPLTIGWLDPEPPGHDGPKTSFSLADLCTLPTAPVAHRNLSHDAAHIFFTSGPSGVPKGVVITHANVLHLIGWATRYFGMSSSDHMSGDSPLYFDSSMLDLFGTFAVGAELHLVPPHVKLIPHHLAGWVRRSRLTQWLSAPSVLDYMATFDAVRPGDFPTLRRLMWCGEAPPTPSLIYWMERLPHVSFTNLYGPTETTIASSYYTVPHCPRDPAALLPIGTVCDGGELLVLDRNLQQVPRGEIGELYIRGPGLSPGYWLDPAATRHAFLPNPHSRDPKDRIYRTGDLARVGDDGLLHLVGRSDSQIERRGYRVELREIEAALHALGSLRECAVVPIRSRGSERIRIGCGYVARTDRDVTPATLRRELRKTLPSYMIPGDWLTLQELPRRADGRIDRRKLGELLREWCGSHRSPRPS